MTSYRRAVTTLAAAAITGILAAGCGSDSDDDASTAPTDTADDATTTTTQASDMDGSVEETSGEACDIVSDDVAAEVLGVDIVRREGTTDPAHGGVSCIKGIERQEDLAKSYYVTVGVVPGGTSLVDEFSAQEGSQPVAGLGDRAGYLPSAGVLYIADGTDYLQVQVVKAGVPASQEDCITVAEHVLDRRG